MLGFVHFLLYRGKITIMNRMIVAAIHVTQVQKEKKTEIIWTKITAYDFRMRSVQMYFS